MANSNLTPSESARALAGMVREEDLEELQALQSELIKRVDQARADGRLYLMGQYVRLVALVSPEIKRITARFHREETGAEGKRCIGSPETPLQSHRVMRQSWDFAGTATGHRRDSSGEFSLLTAHFD